jgi:membrane dipeptidase
MLVDISHLGLGAVAHVLEIATKPVIATHSSSHALLPHHRNLGDDQIRAVADGGGVVCVNFFAGFLSKGEATLDDLLDHLEHMVEVAGAGHVGLGSDFVREIFDEKIPMCDRPLIVEGVDALHCIPGLEGPRGYPMITGRMVERGWSEADILAVLGTNLVDLLCATS